MNDQDFKLYFLGRVMISHFLYRGLDLGKILGIQLFDQKFWYILRLHIISLCIDGPFGKGSVKSNLLSTLGHQPLLSAYILPDNMNVREYRIIIVFKKQLKLFVAIICKTNY